MQPLANAVAVAGQAVLVGCWLPRVGMLLAVRMAPEPMNQHCQGLVGGGNLAMAVICVS